MTGIDALLASFVATVPFTVYRPGAMPAVLIEAVMADASFGLIESVPPVTHGAAVNVRLVVRLMMPRFAIGRETWSV